MACKKKLRQSGFTLLELMIVLSILAALVAVSIPSSIKLYQSMVYRSAVSDVKSKLESTRYQALIKGRVMDVWIQVESRSMGVGVPSQAGAVLQLPESLTLEVVSAAELQLDASTAVIRFYADGSSSGGDISIIRESGAGVRLHIDWLLGKVSQLLLLEQ